MPGVMTNPYLSSCGTFLPKCLSEHRQRSGRKLWRQLQRVSRSVRKRRCRSRARARPRTWPRDRESEKDADVNQLDQRTFLHRALPPRHAGRRARGALSARARRIRIPLLLVLFARGPVAAAARRRGAAQLSGRVGARVQRARLLLHRSRFPLRESLAHAVLLGLRGIPRGADGAAAGDHGRGAALRHRARLHGADPRAALARCFPRVVFGRTGVRARLLPRATSPCS